MLKSFPKRYCSTLNRKWKSPHTKTFQTSEISQDVSKQCHFCHEFISVCGSIFTFYLKIIYEPYTQQQSGFWRVSFICCSDRSPVCDISKINQWQECNLTLTCGGQHFILIRLPEIQRRRRRGSRRRAKSSIATRFNVSKVTLMIVHSVGHIPHS